MNRFTQYSAAVLVAAGIMAVAPITGCSATPKTEAKADALTANVQATLATFKAKDPSLQPLIDKAVGWAVFPDVGKGGWIIGGSYGRGEVYEGGTLIGYSDISEVSAGFQWGAQNFSQLLLFMRQDELDKFKQSQWSGSANLSAVALTEGAAGKTDPSKGVIALVDTKGGLMAEAALGGQRMRFTAK